MGWNASDTRPLTFDGLRGARGQPARPARQRLQAVPAHPRQRPHRRRGDGPRPRPGRARPGARLRQGAQGVRQADLQVPGDPGQARRHGDRDRGRPPADVQGGVAEGPRRELHADRRAGQAQDGAPRGALRRGGRADPRRLRLHRGVPGLPLLPRREDPHDRRGHRRDPADGDRAGARRLWRAADVRWSAAHRGARGDRGADRAHRAPPGHRDGGRLLRRRRGRRARAGRRRRGPDRAAARAASPTSTPRRSSTPPRGRARAPSTRATGSCPRARRSRAPWPTPA